MLTICVILTVAHALPTGVKFYSMRDNKARKKDLGSALNLRIKTAITNIVT